WGSSRDFGRTADNCVRSESVVLFWLTMVSNETIVFERMKTSQISTRVTQADADFLAGLTLEGATTPSDKVRALITEARRRREELGDYKGSLRQVRDLIGPATAAILEAENTSSAHSAVVLPLVDWLAEALAFTLSHVPVSAEDSAARLAELERGLVDRSVRWAQALLRLAVTEEAETYDARVVAARVAPLLALAKVVDEARRTWGADGVTSSGAK